MQAVEIKLTFPTMDAAIAYLIANKAEADVAPAVQVAASPKPKAEKTAEKAAPVSQPAAAVSSPPATVAASPVSSPEASPSPAATAVEYSVLQKAVFTLAGKSREAAAAVAASFGVKTFKELDAARWAEALAAVNAKIAEA